MPAPTVLPKPFVISGLEMSVCKILVECYGALYRRSLPVLPFSFMLSTVCSPEISVLPEKEHVSVVVLFFKKACTQCRGNRMVKDGIVTRATDASLNPSQSSAFLITL